MDQATRNSLQNATQQARRLLELEITEQLEGTFDVLPNGTIADKAGKHLDASQRLVRTKIVESIRHRAGGSAKADMLADAVADYVREAAFTILNRYIALKMLEVRGLVQQCITKGDQSSGFKEFGLAATGLAQLPDKGYRLYLESLVDELSTEVKILFDRHSDASLLWPRRQAFDGLLEILNAEALATVWREDETIGWVYQYFNSDADREKARYDEKGKPKAPQNSYELAVRNQFFTPRYVVEFLTDNTLGRTWYEMRQGVTALTEKCRYLVRRPDEVFFSGLSVPNGTELEGPPLFAKFLADPELGSLLPFAADRPQALIELAHCVDAYSRHPFGQEIEGQWWPWHMRGRMESAARMEEFSTQDILDVMFCQCRADRHGGGDGIADPVFIRLANEVRKRVIDSREPDRAQQQMLRDPVFVRFRPKKDPRDLKILDPACGSSHFLLYCFDLLLTIYAEAWADDQSPPSQLTGKSLREDYPDEASLRLALPGLVLRHNVYGIDIDPRCAQIGAFALWMRAQRAYHEFNIAKESRPPITKANIVVAEPMPGEDDLLNAFLRDLREERLESLIRQALNVPPNRRVTATTAMADSLCDLVRTIWDQMKLAGEAGSLLRIDDALEHAIQTSRSEWHGKHALFRDAEFSLLEAQRDFWAGAESLVLYALSSFARSVGQSAAVSFRRGLFAEDATRGLALIDALRLRFDVVLMNPPFGDPTERAATALTEMFPEANRDIYSCFVVRGIELLSYRGLLGAITPRSGWFLSSMEKWRRSLFLESASLRTLADLGYGVLDAKVETSSYCVEKCPPSGDAAVFLGLLAASDKESSCLAGIGSVTAGQSRPDVHVIDPRRFQQLPTAPFAYAAPPAMFHLYGESDPFESDARSVRAGVQTSDDFRFVRCWWEVRQDTLMSYANLPAWDEDEESFCLGCVDRTVQYTWCPFAKGGEYSPYFADVALVINWRTNGHQLKAYAETTPGTKHWSRNIRSTEFFFRPGLTYLARTSIRLCATPLPAGSIISNEAGPGIFVGTADLYLALARFNSLALEFLSSIFQVRGLEGDDQTKKYVVGNLQRLPWPVGAGDRETCAARVALECMQLLRTSDELSRAFIGPRQVPESEWDAAVKAIWDTEVSVARSYGLDAVFCASQAVGASSESDARTAIRQSLRISSPASDARSSAARMLSYGIGIVMGRWRVQSIEFPDGQSSLPCPFAPLPPRSPAQVREKSVWSGDGAEWKQVGAGVHDQQRTLTDVAVDDPGHPNDLASQVQSVFGAHFGADDEDHWRSAGQELDPRNHDLRSWIAHEFFSWHVKQYSKSNRKAPIYWQMGVPSGRYSFWLYAHSVSKDRLFQVLKDMLQPKLNQEEGVLGRLKQEASGSPTQSQRKAIESQEDFIAELKTMIDDVARVAPMWAPDLDDGVVICLAPLWRLFPQHKSWQKECKRVWDKLVEGDFDWAHMAMHLWPERVVPKCVPDRSFAIAHGLEEMFWLEVVERWRALKAPKEEIEVQKRLRELESSDRLRDALIALSRSSHAAIPSRKLWQAMSHGSLDDQSVALCLWPERVVERAAANSEVAERLEINFADLATSRARAALLAKYEVAELPSMLAAAEAAFGDDRDFTLLWAALAGGQHDDQALALVLWPERVIEKCLKDVELADKHGLRGFFWVQDLATKQWRRRLAPDDEVKQEVQRRFNRTVKDALAKFIEAPAAEGASSRRRRGGAAAAEVEAGTRPTTQDKKRGRPRTVNTEEELF